MEITLPAPKSPPCRHRYKAQFKISKIHLEIGQEIIFSAEVTNKPNALDFVTRCLIGKRQKMRQYISYDILLQKVRHH